VAIDDTAVKTHISVNAARIASLPTTCWWTTNDLRSAGDVMPTSSLVFPIPGITNDVGGTTSAVVASVALLVKSVNFIFIILTFVVPSLYSAMQLQ